MGAKATRPTALILGRLHGWLMKRVALIQQSDATRLFKAARKAGYARARLIRHPDGTIEIVGEDAPETRATVELSPFEQWKASNAR